MSRERREDERREREILHLLRHMSPRGRARLREILEELVRRDQLSPAPDEHW